jgi:hypothetical protein
MAQFWLQKLTAYDHPKMGSGIRKMNPKESRMIRLNRKKIVRNFTKALPGRKNRVRPLLLPVSV